MTPARTADQARTALLQDVPESHVGDALDTLTADVGGAHVTTHLFACTDPAYPGWYWAVALVAVAGDLEPTVSEVNLLPGADALVPPPWQPWATRVQPGDLGVGDLLPTEPGDARLAPGFTEVGDAADLAPLAPAAWELGLGREAILSPLGMDLAVDRWLEGQTGPRAAMAKAAPAQCSTCGFLAPIGGALGQVFGVCANVHGAADGQIVALSFGCGAHSSVRIAASHPVPVVGLAIDDDRDELSDTESLPDFLPEPQPDEDSGVRDDAPDLEHESDILDHMDEDAVAQSISDEPSDVPEEDDTVDWSPTGDEQ